MRWLLLTILFTHGLLGYWCGCKAGTGNQHGSADSFLAGIACCSASDFKGPVLRDCCCSQHGRFIRSVLPQTPDLGERQLQPPVKSDSRFLQHRTTTMPNSQASPMVPIDPIGHGPPPLPDRLARFII